jgi:ADP-ribose pyrophosphatase YjhB (NUDIX family)
VDYITFIRSKVENEKIFLNFSGVWIENENGVLLERRKDNGSWGLIGGAMELGETARETAIRECFEETGLHVELGELIGIYSGYERTLENGDSFQAVAFSFYGYVDSTLTPIASNESFEIRYFPRTELPEFTIDQHRDIAEDALAGRVGVAR